MEHGARDDADHQPLNTTDGKQCVKEFGAAKVLADPPIHGEWVENFGGVLEETTAVLEVEVDEPSVQRVSENA